MILVFLKDLLLEPSNIKYINTKAISCPFSKISSRSLFCFYPPFYLSVQVYITSSKTILKKSSNPLNIPANYLSSILDKKLLFITIQIFVPIHLSRTAKGKILTLIYIFLYEYFQDLF